MNLDLFRTDSVRADFDLTRHTTRLYLYDLSATVSLADALDFCRRHDKAVQRIVVLHPHGVGNMAFVLETKGWTDTHDCRPAVLDPGPRETTFAIDTTISENFGPRSARG